MKPAGCTAIRATARGTAARTASGARCSPRSACITRACRRTASRRRRAASAGRSSCRRSGAMPPRALPRRSPAIWSSLTRAATAMPTMSPLWRRFRRTARRSPRSKETSAAAWSASSMRWTRPGFSASAFCRSRRIMAKHQKNRPNRKPRRARRSVGMRNMPTERIATMRPAR